MTIKVDLLPTEKKKMGFDPVIVFLVIIILCCGGIFWLYGKSLEKTLTDKQAKITELDAKIKDLEGKLPIIEQLKSDNQELKAQINTFKTLRYDPIRYSNILDKIAQIIPRNIWLSSMNVEPATTMVTFQGTAVLAGGERPLSAIADFMKKLQESDYFSDTNLTSAAQTTIEGGYPGFTFQIDAKYNPESATQVSTTPATPAAPPTAAPGEASATPATEGAAPATAPGAAASPGGEAAASPAPAGTAPASPAGETTK